MKLTACYMVRDEEQNLRRSLESIRGVWDELIVVDTGSVDRTKEVAASFGAIVFDFPWCDDFSAPRNAAIERASGDWILFLDADESFAAPKDLRVHLSRLMERAEMDAWLLPLRNVEQGKPNHGSVQYLLRLFQNRADLRYSGRIHENVVRQGGNLALGYAPRGLLLLHTGYAAAIARTKSERNLRILLRESERVGDALPFACYLADAYYGLGKYEQAMHYARLSIENGVELVGDASHIYHLVQECMRHLQLPLSEQLAWAQETLQRFPTLPDALAECGILLSSMGRLAEARERLSAALAHYAAEDYDLRDGSFFSDVIAARVARRLARIARLLDAQEEAARWQEKAEAYEMGEKGAGRVRVSACYIVRDEADDLQKSLASIRDAVDEIIVVATGESEGVREIARSFGAAVYPFAWCDDFSAARNFSLEKATGDWILVLDSDQYLSEATRGNLRAVLDREQEGVAEQLLFAVHNVDADTGEAMSDLYEPRAFRRREGRKYVGRIHEEIRDTLEGAAHLVAPMRHIPAAELQIIHTGYSAARSQEKAERNLRLLLKELRVSKQPELLYMYLAEAYDGIGDAEHAIYYAKRDLATGGHKGVAYASRSHRILLRLYAQQGRTAERLALAASAVRDYPDLPDFHAEYAECLADALEYEAALRESERSAALAAGYDGLEPSNIDAKALAVMERRRAVWRAIRARAKEMRLFACLIVRDAGEDFVRWAENAKTYADALIVVDTGSTDGTRERAAKAGAAVIDLPWQGDFAAARNAALAAAEGADWVTVLDADEAFFDPGKVRVFAARTELGTPQIDAVQLPIVHVDEDDHDREMKRQPYIRLLRMGRALFYEGRVHEQLKKACGEPNLLTEGRHLPIRHTGYSTGRIRAKVRRNLALIEQEIAEGGKKPHHDRYLADCYYGLGDYARALVSARAALASSVRSIGAQSDLHHLILGAMQELSLPLAEQVAAAREAVQAFPELPDFHGILGELLVASDPQEAREQLEKALALAKRGAGAEASQFAERVARTYAALAACCLALGDMAAAERAAHEALARSAHETNALDVLCTLYEGEGTERLLARLTEIVGDTEEGRGFLLRFAESYGHIALCCHLIQSAEGVSESLYEKARVQQAESLLTELAADASNRIREAPAVLLALEACETPEAAHLAQRLAALLPPAMQAFWQAYRGADVSHAAWAEGWTLFAPAFRRWGSDAQVERVLPLLSALDDVAKAAFFHPLVAGRRFAAALSVAGIIAADSPVADSGFWYDLGRAFFASGEQAAARECWGKAISLDPAHGGARAYLVWTAQENQTEEVRA